MRRSTLWRALALVFAFVLVAGACGRDEEGGSSDDTTADGSDDGNDDGDDAAAGPATTDACDSYEASPGITDDSITFGSSFPKSGLFAAFAEIAAGWQAQFDTINEAGGINGRQVNVISEDDEYQAANTTRNVQGLIEEDGVFGLYSVVGTPNNLAIQPQQNADCVPNIFTATGAPQMSVPDQYPWTIGLIPTYGTEMGAFVQYLGETNPSATVAILYQNDDFGEGYFDAFNKLIEGTDITVVADTTYDATNTDVTSQIADLAGSDADTLILGTTTLACPNALGALGEQSGWDPVTYISATCTSSTLMGLAPPGSGDGVMSAFYLKDPSDPQWADDPAMQEFQEQGAAAGLDDEQLNNGIVGYGWTSGAVLAWVLENSPELTRVDVMNTAYHIDGLEAGLLLPGITVTTNGTDDPYPIESMQLGLYNGEFWDLQEDLYSFEGESGQFSGD